jgi:hypothetical protein
VLWKTCSSNQVRWLFKPSYIIEGDVAPINRAREERLGTALYAPNANREGRQNTVPQVQMWLWDGIEKIPRDNFWYILRGASDPHANTYFFARFLLKHYMDKCRHAGKFVAFPSYSKKDPKGFDDIAGMIVSGNVNLGWFSSSESQLATIIKTTTDKLLARKLKKECGNRLFKGCLTHDLEAILVWLRVNTSETNAEKLSVAANIWHVVMKAYPRNMWRRFVDSGDRGVPGDLPDSCVTLYCGNRNALVDMDIALDVAGQTLQKLLIRPVMHVMLEHGVFTHRFLQWLVMHRGLYVLSKKQRVGRIKPNATSLQYVSSTDPMLTKSYQ